jgi:nucleoside-diphosphate-sugar epimerase
MRILIIGCGYVGLPLGERLARAGHEVFGIRRNISGLASHAIRPLQADITQPATLKTIELNYDAVINLVSSTRGGPEEYRQVYLEGSVNILQWLQQSPPSRYIYTSSTSVYGQTDGSWVTESSPTNPDSITSRVLVETEKLLHNCPFAITLRVGGIYGPARGHLFHQYLRGEATLRDDGSSYLNNIHLQDVTAAIMHLLSAGTPGETYNLVDNEPITQLSFFQWLSKELGKPLPPSAPADPTRKRGVTNKRISNAKLRSTGYTFLYPTFREGYLAEMQALGIR